MEVGMQPVRPHKRAETSANDVFFIFEWVTRAATLAHERLLPSIDKLSPVIDFVNQPRKTGASRDAKRRLRTEQAVGCTTRRPGYRLPAVSVWRLAAGRDIALRCPRPRAAAGRRGRA